MNTGLALFLVSLCYTLSSKCFKKKITVLNNANECVQHRHLTAGAQRASYKQL